MRVTPAAMSRERQCAAAMSWGSFARIITHLHAEIFGIYQILILNLTTIIDADQYG